MDELLKDFKNLKQKLLKKLSKKENFLSMKNDYFKNYSHNENTNMSMSMNMSMNPSSYSIITDKLTSVSSMLPISNPFRVGGSNLTVDTKKNNSHLPKKITHARAAINQAPIVIPPEEIDRYKESFNVISMFKESESKDLEKTKTIIFELSELMNVCQKKMFEQSEMTQESI
jgi:hypothetical protein